MKKLLFLMLAVTPAVAMDEQTVTVTVTVQNRPTTMRRLLFDAINANHEHQFRRLVPSVNIESIEDYGTLLIMVLRHSPASESRNNMARFLLEKGANVNAQNSHGGTAIQAAAVRANTIMVAELLRRNANPNLRDNQYGNALLGMMPAITVFKHLYPQYKDVITQLLVAKTDPNTRGLGNKTAFELLNQSGDAFQLSQEQKAEIRELLLQHGAKE